MPKSTILYSSAALFFIAGYVLLQIGFRKTDFKSAIKEVHYRPVKNYGKGYAIALGILCIFLGLMLLTLKTK